ncbi:MAG: hypothetical protein PHW95_02845 [Patescibacteria group bacterium]|nr:hypothetical protein [Patescibacteria group bacterium]
MILEDKNNADDFFRALGQNLSAANPPDDEIVFRDDDGKLKILKGGAILDYSQDAVGAEEKSGVKLEAVSESNAVLTNVLPQPDSKLDNIAEQIIKDSGVTSKDDDYRKRFKSIILSRLKDVRDQVQTREALLSSSMVGGVDLNNQQVDKILGLISASLDQVHSDIRTAINNEPFSDLRAEAQQILSEPELAQKPEFKPVILVPEKKVEVEPPAKPVAIPAPMGFSTNPVTARLGANPPKITPIVEKSIGKPKVEDVRFKPRLTGPVEEIKSMKLVDFRRLAQSPAQAIEKIIGKIDLLEAEAFTKKTEAIKAWKQNEINQMYIELGDQSMEERKSISDIIAERQSGGQPTLTEEEVDAIIELNKRLRY